MCDGQPRGDRDTIAPPSVPDEPAGRNYSAPWRRSPGRLLGIGLVRSYQLTLSPLIGSHCRHLPTCSEYAFEALARHGLWSGGWLSLFRIGRCGPFGTSGIDNVPPTLPAAHRWWTPWRLLRAGDLPAGQSAPGPR
ncbi:membrane protein insertion efficiency factor YidD [Aurantimonas sp. A2-1-M11]|uniref:membrane protein insertion efficiency factor YidD n=1 Tax=Aurantimonas sp. A2-1-M11 TaxID=3113712 RepID=UPI002F9498A9